MCRQPIAMLFLAFGVALSIGCDRIRSEAEGSPSKKPYSSNNEMVQLTGTWTGALKCDNGDELPAVFKVSESGNPIYEYQTKSGDREVELTNAGQTFRFVPPDGGVTNVMVDSLDVSADRIKFSMSMSEEKASRETLSQGKATILCEARLSGTELDVQMTINSQSTASQPGIVIPSEGSTVVCRGGLRKQ
ncbi:MAG TPA: hypothetical protein VJS64_12830 [Pyrinomonadaceae bacterium]|nr:hypothetical protein [Pyrinomonadaceae bacterium]